jgi:malate synthase
MSKDTAPFFEIPYYHDYVSPALAKHLLLQASTIPGVDGISHIGETGGLETPDALNFMTQIYESVKSELALVLNRRIKDREFIDMRVKACFEFNKRVGREITDNDYQTILGLQDSEGRIVIGPHSAQYCLRGGNPIAPIPDFLRGPHVTLFGPPDTAKMAINAMNAYHRKLAGEPPIVEQLLKTQSTHPKWGADDEDSKTPLRQDLVDAGVNLSECFAGTLSLKEDKKSYHLAPNFRSLPIKRFPGLALPATFMFYRNNPIPLHLYDFALHVFANWHNPSSLTFYVPKLENEEEARYIHHMIATTEAKLCELHPAYKPGTIRVMIVLENPRAILRTHEIIDALYPYFVGASLGWHDYLGSTARLFKEDGHYRIPVKADPNIVIKYIKASHSMLADVVGSRGGIKVGGMYGILPIDNDIKGPSFQVTLRGYFKDVITQLKRDLTGFWVAHPDFVRLGLAIVEAWRLYKTGQEAPLFTLTKEIFTDQYRRDVDAFIRGDDISGLDPTDPNYVRSLLVVDIKESDFIPNNHPDEIRYNVFQSLQYLTDWLRGNGCVALPTIIDDVPVRVMDDLATAERSRWEVWHELRHDRFKLEDFLQIAHEEMRFIRKDLSDSKKIVQVKWTNETAKWYPIAFRLMIKLMTDDRPVEFATELLMPFTINEIRSADDPLAKAMELDPGKLALRPYIERWNYYFERCGCQRFASTMAALAHLDEDTARELIIGFDQSEMSEAAAFHGDIGESPKTLDHMAQREQRRVSEDVSDLKQQLAAEAKRYRDKFGFKFLISAQDQSTATLLASLRARMENNLKQELANANQALWDITAKRIKQKPLDELASTITTIAKRFEITGVQVALTAGGGVGTICYGDAKRGQSPVTDRTLFEIASLSKTIATAFAMEYFAAKGICFDTSVNSLFAQTKSQFRLRSPSNPLWGDQVTLRHLVSHSALNLHYVKGFAVDSPMPAIGDIVFNSPAYGYENIAVINNPGSRFSYSGGGFLVLEYLIESMENQSIQEMTKPFLKKLGLTHVTMTQSTLPSYAYADGYFDNGQVVPGGRLMFPAFAAGAMATAADVLRFLVHLQRAFHDINGSGAISHDTAVQMMRGADRGCIEFMGCKMGLGVFVAEMGDNRVAIHQGANEGFRSIFMHVVDGPDAGKGLTILCNADNRGVLFIAEVTKCILKSLSLQGLNLDASRNHFDGSQVSQEQLVNRGYKELIFKCLEPTLPEPIRGPRCKHPLAEYDILRNADIVAVSNQRFARAENLISPYEPCFDPTLFGRQGKVMDSWESARHNESPCDYLIIAPQKPAPITFVRLSTKFHDGNQAEYVRILGRQSSDHPWLEILPKTQMTGHSERRIRLAQATSAFENIKIEMYPDGGLTRVALYPQSLPSSEATSFVTLLESRPTRFKELIPKTAKPMSIPFKKLDPQDVASNIKRAQLAGQPIDYASTAFGGVLISATNEHYGPAAQVISPFPPMHMFDGLESARSRKLGHSEEVVIQLGAEVAIGAIELDFKFFVNNNPRYISFFARSSQKDASWEPLREMIDVKAFAGNQMRILFDRKTKARQMKVCTIPDGGINRIHVFSEA